MDDIQRLMVELAGADPATVNRIAAERGSLPVRLAMLGLAALRKRDRPLWWGYPPGVFIGYKWDGAPMTERVRGLADHLRARGYRAYLDVENLDADADAYFAIPEYIARIEECQLYVLLLTARAADLIDARGQKTSWLHDEVRHAFGLVNAGRLNLVPVLLEADGRIDALRGAPHLDLTGGAGWEALDAVLPAGPLALDEADTEELRLAMARFDGLFLGQQWDAAAAELVRASRFEETFDLGFRRMLHALYTADGPGFEVAFESLCAREGRNVVLHLYRGYCARHQIPVRISG